MATTIEDLEERLNTFEQSLIQMGINLSPTIYKVDDTSNRVDALTPYTETKAAYYGETEKVFYDAPAGNTSVFFDNYNGAYSVNRVDNRLIVSFDALTQATNITISIQ